MAVDAYLQIAGVEGESTAAGHEGWIDLQEFHAPGGAHGAFELADWSFSVENPTTIGSATGGAGAGKASFSEFTVTKTTDKSSTAFLLHAANGASFPTATIHLVKRGGGGGGKAGAPFLVFRFQTVFTTKVQWSDGGDGGPEEEISFVYGSIEVQYTAQDGSTSDFTWDVARNRVP